MTKQIKLVILTILIITSSNILKAQTTTEEFFNEFFTLYEKSPEEAISILSRDFDLAYKQSFEFSKKKYLSNISQAGALNGYEKIMERSVGNSLKLVSYLLKYEKEPVRFTIIFYKPKDRWVIRRFQFDTDLKEELMESRKVPTIHQ